MLTDLKTLETNNTIINNKAEFLNKKLILSWVIRQNDRTL